MIGGRSTTSAAEASLREVGLGERLHHLPAELSGGEQQRVAIARALTNDPDIIFADEPTGNLDSKTGDAIIDLLLNLARSRKKTLLVVTHDSRLAELGERQLRIVDGVAGVKSATSLHSFRLNCLLNHRSFSVLTKTSKLAGW